MSKKTWIIFVVVVVAILGGLVFLSRKDQVNVSDIDQSKVIAASVANGNIADHVSGPKNGKSILIEYGDFQCPACGRAHPILKDMTTEFKDELTFIFRNNPLTAIHPNARAGSAAAEAAGLQGKYWEMHDLLYVRQQEWSESSPDQRVDIFLSYAKQVGVKDLDKFKSDLDSKAVSDKINFDLALGKKVPVQGTPTILLDGKKIESDVWSDQEKFKEVIKESLK